MVSEHVYQRSKDLHEKPMKILDVGCSTGRAARYMRDYLKKLGVECVIDGLDISERVRAKAKKNLHEFYSGNLFDKQIEPVYDIVICSRMLRYMDPKTQHAGISKCMSFCNNTGVIITDALPYATRNVNGYVMVTRDKAVRELERHIVVWNNTPRLCKIWKSITNCFFSKPEIIIPGIAAVPIAVLLCQLLC